MFCVEVAIDYVQWKKYAMQESQLKRKNYLDQGQQWSLRQVNKNKQTNTKWKSNCCEQKLEISLTIVSS